MRVEKGIMRVVLGASLALLPACTDGPASSELAGDSTNLFGAGTSQATTGNGTTPGRSNGTDAVVFGSGFGIRTGAATRSADTVVMVDGAVIDRSMHGVGTVTINGKIPSLWTEDQRLLTETTMVELVPRYDTMPSALARLTGDGLLSFRNLRAANYHMVVRDGGSVMPWVSRMFVDSEGKSHINMVSFFVTPVSIFSPARLTGTLPSPLTIDLYWDTQSFPCTQVKTGADPNPARPHKFGQYYTYEDSFSIKGRSFDANDSPVEYRFVVYDGFSVWWQSDWHSPDASGYVKVTWNGYSSFGSGPADMPSETRTGNTQLPEGSYYYGVQFKQQGCKFPFDAPNPSRADELLQYRNGNFIQTFYGASQVARFTLKHGIKPAPAPTPTPTPAPSGA